NLAISIVPRNVECDKFNCIYSSTARTQHESFSRLTRSFMIAGAPLLANLIKKDDKCFFLCIIRILSWQQRETKLRSGSSVGLEYLPVTQGVAGSSPVRSASFNVCLIAFIRSNTQTILVELGEAVKIEQKLC